MKIRDLFESSKPASDINFTSYSYYNNFDSTVKTKIDDLHNNASNYAEALNKINNSLLSKLLKFETMRDAKEINSEVLEGFRNNPGTGVLIIRFSKFDVDRTTLAGLSVGPFAFGMYTAEHIYNSHAIRELRFDEAFFIGGDFTKRDLKAESVSSYPAGRNQAYAKKLNNEIVEVLRSNPRNDPRNPQYLVVDGLFFYPGEWDEYVNGIQNSCKKTF